MNISILLLQGFFYDFYAFLMKKRGFSKTNEKNSLECMILGKYFQTNLLKKPGAG